MFCHYFAHNITLQYHKWFLNDNLLALVMYELTKSVPEKAPWLSMFVNCVVLLDENTHVLEGKLKTTE